LNLQYPVTLYPDQEGGYVAQIKDLPGCLTQGETLDEAIANINEARELWIETAGARRMSDEDASQMVCG
jgi:predicted RNase H-like HicB family nuclease